MDLKITKIVHQKLIGGVGWWRTDLIGSVCRYAPNVCQHLGEASELTKNAQRVASALRNRAHAEHTQSVLTERMFKKVNECTACC